MGKRASPRKKWSARVTRESHALTLDEGVFSQRSPGAIARSLKRSAERSRARKSAPYRSAMSMLTFYVNRWARASQPAGPKTLEGVKDELRRLFDKQKA
jgi:Protein of unknown function (DUF3175)